MEARVRIAGLFFSLLLSAGCTGSRWARSDPDYAAKYPHHTDNLARMTKQAVDARHVVGKRGVYAGATGRSDPLAAGAKVGVFAYPQSYLENYAGLAGLAHDGDRPQLSGGFELGARLQVPARLAPFAGVNGYVGFWKGNAASNGLDDNGNGFVDEDLESFEDDAEAVFAATPEAGVHFWATPRVRLSASAGYQFITGGSETDSLTYGLSLSLLGAKERSPAAENRTSTSDDSWQFITPETAEPLFVPPEDLPPLEESVAPE